MAESANLLGLVEDITLNLQLAHDAEFPEMLEQIGAGNVGLYGYGLLRKFVVACVFLHGVGSTSCTFASDATAKE